MSVYDGRKRPDPEPWPEGKVPTNNLERLIASVPPAPIQPGRPQKAERMFCVMGSNGTSLRFCDARMYADYQRDSLLLELRYYKRIRDQYGVWASNQNKFVPGPEHLKQWDSKYMEEQLQIVIDGGLIDG